MKKYINGAILFLFILQSCSGEEYAQNNFHLKAKEAKDYCIKNGLDTNYCLLVDFSIHSGKNRLVLWDFKQNKVLFKGLCTHGSCSGDFEKSNSKVQPQFSNVSNSHCSSEGKFRIGIRSYSNWGVNIHYKLHGLESNNDNVYKRVVVLHSWELVPDEEVYPKPIVKSWGCPAVSNNMMLKLDSLLKKQKKPTLLWIYNGVISEENKSSSIEKLSYPLGNSKLAKSALSLTFQKVMYDPSYFKISYPNGDVPSNKGVCTDVVIRAYRLIGVDLQKLVHEDMKSNFDKYPNNWGLKSTDVNIDHRRVPNLMVFFSRKGNKLSNTNQTKDYLPGDIVCWDLGNGILHIGLVSDKKSENQSRYLVIHNIGAGQVLEDFLFKAKIIGHYRY